MNIIRHHDDRGSLLSFLLDQLEFDPIRIYIINFLREKNYEVLITYSITTIAYMYKRNN